MIFRTHHEGTMYVIEAPEGSRVVIDGEGHGELALFQLTPTGTVVERRLPPSVVLKAAQRGFLGLEILEERSPSFHPEVASFHSLN